MMLSRRWWWTTLLVLAGTAVLVRLGIWQLDRLAARRDFNAHVLAMQAEPALILPGEPVGQDLTGMEYRLVQAAGVYDFDHQVALRNQVWTHSWGDEIGFALLTPLVLADGRAVLVERGWVARGDESPQSWRQFDQPGTVTVSGIIRLPLAEPEMGGGVPDPTLAPGQPGLDFWTLVDIRRLQEQMPWPLLPVYIQQAPGTDPAAPPYRALPELDLTDGPHLGYAFQWFTFAALLFFGYPVYLKRQGESSAARPRT
jgi:surfeit locus 1 family protein